MFKKKTLSINAIQIMLAGEIINILTHKNKIFKDGDIRDQAIFSLYEKIEEYYKDEYITLDMETFLLEFETFEFIRLTTIDYISKYVYQV